MKQIVRAFLFLLLFAAASNTTMADEKANIVKQGTVRGRIIDVTKQTLPGASIYIEKLHTGVTSDVNGFYTFPNLDPGTYTVKVSYVGYSPVELKITIPAGRTLEKDVVLNEGVELQEVVVGGAFQGQRRAINAQKSNLGITNVVSADQVGKFPDSNIGDALKRISGINVQYDQGEARFGQVRGTSADLSSVTVNGNRVPSAEGDTRNVQLDLIPADMIQTIWNVKYEQKDFIESMAEAANAVNDYIKDNNKQIVYITIMNDISVDCDCDKSQGDPVINDLGIVASLDPVANDQAFIDMIWNTNEEGTKLIKERIDSRYGRHILPYAESLGLGSTSYELIDIDKM